MKNLFKIKSFKKKLDTKLNNLFKKENSLFPQTKRKFSQLINSAKTKKNFFHVSLITSGVVASFLLKHQNDVANMKSLAEMPYDPRYEFTNEGTNQATLYVEYDKDGNRTDKAFASTEMRFDVAFVDLILYCGLPFFAIGKLIPKMLGLDKGMYKLMGQVASVISMLLYAFCDFLSFESRYFRSAGKELFDLQIVDDVKHSRKVGYFRLFVKCLVDNFGWSLVMLLNFIDDFPGKVITIGGSLVAYNLFNMGFLLYNDKRTLGEVFSGLTVVKNSSEYFVNLVLDGYDIASDKYTDRDERVTLSKPISEFKDGKFVYK